MIQMGRKSEREVLVVKMPECILERTIRLEAAPNYFAWSSDSRIPCSGADRQHGRRLRSARQPRGAKSCPQGVRQSLVSLVYRRGPVYRPAGHPAPRHTSRASISGGRKRSFPIWARDFCSSPLAATILSPPRPQSTWRPAGMSSRRSGSDPPSPESGRLSSGCGQRQPGFQSRRPLGGLGAHVHFTLVRDFATGRLADEYDRGDTPADDYCGIAFTPDWGQTCSKYRRTRACRPFRSTADATGCAGLESRDHWTQPQASCWQPIRATGSGCS